MKKCRLYLSMLLVCALALSLLPAQALASTVRSAYTVLFESAIDVYQLGSPYNDANILDGNRIVRYDGSGIQTVNVGVSVTEWVYGFTPSGYAVVDQYTDHTSVIDSTGRVVYQLNSGETLQDLSDDGYVIISVELPGVPSGFFVIELATGRQFHQDDWNWNSKIPTAYNEGVLVVGQTDPQTQDSVYTYEDLEGNQILTSVGKMDGYSHSEFHNGFAIIRRVKDNNIYREVIDKTGRVVLSDEGMNGLTIWSVGSDNMVTMWDSNYDTLYVNVANGLDNLPSARYEDGREFCNGYAVVYNDNYDEALIDTNGNVVIPFGQYQSLSDVSSTGLVWAIDQNQRLCVLKVGEQTDPGADPNPGTDPTPTIRFVDVPEGSWFYDAVYWAVDEGITTGTGVNPPTFSPSLNCKQVEILTFLWRANGRPESTAQLPFTPKNAWADQALSWGFEKGMIGAGFDEDAPCTRATAVKFIWQAAGSPAVEGNVFSDVADDADYVQAVAWAVENSVTTGTGVDPLTFSPDDICTRAQIVTFLNRAYT